MQIDTKQTEKATQEFPKAKKLDILMRTSSKAKLLKAKLNPERLTEKWQLKVD